MQDWKSFSTWTWVMRSAWQETIQYIDRSKEIRVTGNLSVHGQVCRDLRDRKPLNTWTGLERYAWQEIIQYMDRSKKICVTGNHSIQGQVCGDLHDRKSLNTWTGPLRSGRQKIIQYMDRSSETGVTVRIYRPTIVKSWTYRSKVLIHCMSTIVYHNEYMDLPWWGYIDLP